jgi:pimeloyl-ACP methyl ester carboxylesterase
MAAALGPSEDDCKTQISDGSMAHDTPDGSANALSYSPDVLARAQSPAASFIEKTRYYTDGAATGKWQKSLETLAWLYNIEAEDSGPSNIRKRRASLSGIFEPVHSGSLRAPATVLWGQKDQACTQRICLDGISDYLQKGSQVVLLPRTAHWTAVEKESRVALGRVIEWFLDGGDMGSKGDVISVVKEVYGDATLQARK